MKITKLDMAKVIVTALYNLDELVTEENAHPMRHAKKMARKDSIEQLKQRHEIAMRVIQNKRETK